MRDMIRTAVDSGLFQSGFLLGAALATAWAVIANACHLKRKR